MGFTVFDRGSLSTSGPFPNTGRTVPTRIHGRLTASSSSLHMNPVFTSPLGQELETRVVVLQDVKPQLVNKSGRRRHVRRASRDQTGQPTSSPSSPQPSFAVCSSLTRITSCRPISLRPSARPSLPPLSGLSHVKAGRGGTVMNLI